MIHRLCRRIVVTLQFLSDGWADALPPADKLAAVTTYALNPDDPTHSLEEVWPPFGLQIESPRLALRQVRESDFPAYLAAASSGVTRTDRNPFTAAWNENPPEQLARTSLPWLWSKRGEVGPDAWYLMLGIFLKDDDGAGSGGDGAPADRVDGVVRPGERLIGMQDVSAVSWATLRTVVSGSWLRTDHQGQGYGKEARAAMLLWAFDHFGAEYAESGAYDWNERSRRVSESLGYAQSGARRVVDAHGEEPEWEIQYRLDRHDFRRPDWPVYVRGSDRLKNFLEGCGWLPR